MRQLFLDIETTGFSREWNEIIELAAILYDDQRKEMIDSFHMYAKPSKGIPGNITELTGITNEQVENCKPEWSMLLDFCNWYDDHQADIIIGHNCKAFDLQFIKAKCDKYKLSWGGEKAEVVDTLTLARNLKKKNLIAVENCKQPTLGAYFGINYEAHSALSDVRALISIYGKMKSCETPDRSSLGF
jgi:DNA polymerase III alpha subunit (gram-positive type)